MCHTDIDEPYWSMSVWPRATIHAIIQAEQEPAYKSGCPTYITKKDAAYASLEATA